LRMFLEGKFVLPSDVNSLFLHRVSNSRNYPQHSAVQSLASFFQASTPCTLSCFQEAVLEPILSTTIFSRLRTLQSSLDSLDIEGLSTLLLTETGVDLFTCDEDTLAIALRQLGVRPDPTLSDWEAWLSRWMAQGCTTFELRDHIFAYLLSATFKDCSIVIRLQRSERGGTQFDVNITAIDFDPKPVLRLLKYAKLDRQIVDAFKVSEERYGSAGRNCYV